MLHLNARTLCVATSYTPNFAPLGDICAATLRHYAKTFGCDAYIDPSPAIPENRPSPWHRVKLIPELFDKGYDYVLWVDADALFVRFDVDVRDEMPEGIDLCMVRHDVPWCPTALVPNTGVMLLRNCDWSRWLLRTLWAKTEYVNHYWWENAAMIDLLGYKSLLGFPGAGRPNDDVLSHIRWLDEAWNFVPRVSKSPRQIIKHYGGLPFAERVRGMAEAFGELAL
jgi:hypothetical protein